MHSPKLIDWMLTDWSPRFKTTPSQEIEKTATQFSTDAIVLAVCQSTNRPIRAREARRLSGITDPYLKAIPSEQSTGQSIGHIF